MDRLLYYLRMTEEDGLFFFWTKEILIALGIFFLFFGLSRIVRTVLMHSAPRFAARLRLDEDGKVLGQITAPASLLVVCAGLYLAIRELPLSPKVHLVAGGALFVVNVIIITIIVTRITDEMLARFARRVGTDDLTLQLMPLAEKLVTIFLIGMALIITLKHFDYDILSLVTALGIGSLAIGLAAKDTLANMISGFTLMLDRPFRIGDTIKLAAGQTGDVIDIGLRSTRIKSPDNSYLIIPNSELCNTTIVNMAFPDIRTNGKVTLGVALDTDVESAKRLMVEAATALYPEVLADPAPNAFFVAFGESSISLSLIFWVASYRDLFGITDRINCAILKSFQENGITIPSARTVILEKEVKHAP
ncbi:mechanosensitive ion channel family protein [Geomonas sp. RF6]|uniref:mechanosensitive ion channel family protein n=1 Tax=Geomonas sp. RF6 TaxID=2897342 RepID=UPI001E5BD76B|nr:mechanosensitive ion channel family protein [Geomonas sp. RF6]UFS70089.1 mechanosensitive ion channel family protein [Geomonas sp. RF6]